MNEERQSLFPSLFRFGLYVLFWILLWKSFGWGWSLSAMLVLLATGYSRGKSVVPIPGLFRVVLELVFLVAGIVAVSKMFGTVWVAVMVILSLAVYFLNIGYLKNILRHHHA